MATANTINVDFDRHRVDFNVVSEPTDAFINYYEPDFPYFIYADTRNNYIIQTNPYNEERTGYFEITATTTADSEYNGTAEVTCGYTVVQEARPLPPHWEVDFNGQKFNKLGPTGSANPGTIILPYTSDNKFKITYKVNTEGFVANKLLNDDNTVITLTVYVDDLFGDYIIFDDSSFDKVVPTILGTSEKVEIGKHYPGPGITLQFPASVFRVDGGYINVSFDYYFNNPNNGSSIIFKISSSESLEILSQYEWNF